MSIGIANQKSFVDFSNKISNYFKYHNSQYTRTDDLKGKYPNPIHKRELLTTNVVKYKMVNVEKKKRISSQKLAPHNCWWFTQFSIFTLPRNFQLLSFPFSDETGDSIEIIYVLKGIAIYARVCPIIKWNHNLHKVFNGVSVFVDGFLFLLISKPNPEQCQWIKIIFPKCNGLIVKWIGNWISNLQKRKGCSVSLFRLFIIVSVFTWIENCMRHTKNPPKCKPFSICMQIHYPFIWLWKSVEYPKMCFRSTNTSVCIYMYCENMSMHKHKEAKSRKPTDISGNEKQKWNDDENKHTHAHSFRRQPKVAKERVRVKLCLE